MRDSYVSDLVLGQVPLDRVKLLVCGAAGVGKTELTNSLKCHILRSLFRRRSNSNFQQMILKRTHGMIVQQANIPNTGNFSIWDFSGMKEFYVSHENFVSDSNSVFLLVLSLRDPVIKQLAQMRFWLAMIKAKFCPHQVSSRTMHRPFVILVASFVDQQRPTNHIDLHSNDIFAVPLASSIQQPLDNGKSILETISKEFGDFFDFSNTVYAMDCRLSQSLEMRSLRMLLGSIHANVIKVYTYVYVRCRMHKDFLQDVFLKQATKTHTLSFSHTHTHTHTHTHILSLSLSLSLSLKGATSGSKSGVDSLSTSPSMEKRTC